MGCYMRLKVRANPLRNQVPVTRPDMSKYEEATGCPVAGKIPDAFGILDAVMPLDVLGRTRVTLTETASSSLVEILG